MKKGTVIVNGNAGKNTGAVLNGGTVVIDGNTGDFTAFEMRNGTIIVNGNAGKFLGAKKKGGVIYAKDGAPVPPTKKYPQDNKDKELLKNYGLVGDFYRFQ
jgi:formylmethanofuran dehydrogenase subunit C